MQEKMDSIRLSLPGFEAEEQDSSFFEHLPYSDFRRWVPENSIYEKALRQIPALSRLTGIKCLSFLSYVGPDPKNMYFTEFTHSRLDHALTVALINEEILKQNGLPQDKVDLGIIAALLHDIATPAYGDATKQVDIKKLHEEDYWWQVLNKKGKDFITQFGTKEAIDKIIKNQGLLGRILDISDRITYTMKDLNALQVAPPRTGQQFDPYLADLNLIISNYPKIGNIYREVGIDQKKQEVFFNNPDSLSVFLNLRAHLHQKLYMHPISQARDLAVAKAIAQIYSKDKNSILSPDKLRKMTDYNLLQILANHYGKSTIEMHPLLVNWVPEFEKFNSIDEAKKKEEELKQIENILVVGIKECRGFDPATSYKVANGYKYVKFEEYDFFAADKIKKIAQKTKGIFLFWFYTSENFQTNNLLRTILQKK